MQFSISFKFIFSHSLYTFYVSRAQKLRFHTERHENMSKFLLSCPNFSPHAVPLSQYFQGSTGKYKGTVNQHIFFIATKLINFCKLNTKINSII